MSNIGKDLKEQFRHIATSDLTGMLMDVFRWICVALKIGEFAWEYGTFRDGQPGRRHIRNGNVQFVLWKAGQHGHTENFWYDADRSWWPSFQASELRAKGE